jgi:hypothetical protein
MVIEWLGRCRAAFVSLRRPSRQHRGGERGDPLGVAAADRAGDLGVELAEEAAAIGDRLADLLRPGGGPGEAARQAGRGDGRLGGRGGDQWPAESAVGSLERSGDRDGMASSLSGRSTVSAIPVPPP